jgi:hypothetical protein
VDVAQIFVERAVAVEKDRGAQLLEVVRAANSLRA